MQVFILPFVAFAVTSIRADLIPQGYASPAPSFASPAPSFASPAPSFASPAPSFASPAPRHASGSYQNPQQFPDTPAQYQYNYGVNDNEFGVNFGQNEARDGLSTYGEYHVALPDGRIQTVKYSVADANSGYVAEVSYSGEARYDAIAPRRPAPKIAPAAFRSAAPPTPAFSVPSEFGPGVSPSSYASPAPRARISASPNYGSPTPAHEA